MKQEAITTYSTAKEYIETIKLVLTSPHYKDKHVMVAIRPTHLLAGFAIELMLKSWLLAHGEKMKGHKLLDLRDAAIKLGLVVDKDMNELIEKLAYPHGQDGDYVFRYTRQEAKIEPLIWSNVLPILDKFDVRVDREIGASRSCGLEPGH